jgi:molybdopterin/thiamine biosynthesis adenylyltransferase
LNRYSRQTILPWFGSGGQERLAAGSVLMVGCGGTGCTCSAFLARSGLGKIVLVDPDVVSLTDLHRQILYDEADTEHLAAKVDAAGDALRRSNSGIDVEIVHARFGPGNAAELVGSVDLVVDCSDNFETRMVINDACLAYRVDWVHGACTGTSGLVIPFPSGGTVCYRCVVDHVPTRLKPGAAPTAVFGPAAGMVGCLEASTAIKMLIAPESVHAGIVFFDMASGTYEAINVRHRKGCPACEQGRREVTAPHRDKEGFDSESRTARVLLAVSVDLTTIRERLGVAYQVEDTGRSLRVVVPEGEVLFMPGGIAVVRPAQSLDQARRLVQSLLEG